MISYTSISHDNHIWTIGISCFMIYCHCSLVLRARFPWPPVCYVPRRAYIEGCKIFGPHTKQFVLLPNSPMSDWLSQIRGCDFLWSPRYSEPWKDESTSEAAAAALHRFLPRVMYNDMWNNSVQILSTTSKVGSPWRDRCPKVSDSQIYSIRKFLCLGTFILPEGNIYSCPASRKRFCIELQHPTLSFLKSKKIRKQLKNFRFSVNRAFPEALRLARLEHHMTKGSTWITEEFSEMMWWFVCHETPGDARNECLNIVSPSSEEFSTSVELGQTSDGCRTEPSRPLDEKMAEQNRINLGQASFDGWDDAWHQTIESVNECPNLYPPIRTYSFELWDTETKVLVAATFTYIIGTVACDFTCVTVEKDHRSCGTVLSRVVAETLKRCGVTLWYWGSELPYMKQFWRDHYGGVQIDSKKFYRRWWKEALGCQKCGKEFDFGKHRRTCSSSNSRPVTSNSRLPNSTLFVCDKCAKELEFYNIPSADEDGYLSPDVAQFIDDGRAPVAPLDFTPIVSIR